MRKSFYFGLLFACAALFAACSHCTIESASYQRTGPAVLTANGILLTQQPHGLQRSISGEEYKDLLKDDHPSMYSELEPYRIAVSPDPEGFIVKVYDGDKLIMLDAACTEDRIDCWVYRGECTESSFSAPCPAK